MMFVKAIFILVVCILDRAFSDDDYDYAETYTRKIPDELLIGTATASYQVEGAWNEDGKGENIWDYVLHEHPERVDDGSNGDIACDSYHKYQEDVDLLADMGAEIYRFSISWPRILPTGLSNQVNVRGIQYYNNLINALLEKNIEPVVTLYHWDLPEHLQNVLGGWANPDIVYYYTEYARVAFANFGDRVKYWLTFNEPQQFCLYGYGGVGQPPMLGYEASGIVDYLCGYNVIRSHAAAYHLYVDSFKEQQRGKIGIALAAGFTFAGDSDSKTFEAQERNMAFDIGWFSHPIFSKEGNYPQVMIDRIAARSEAEGFPRSRLPPFTQEEIEYIRGTADFFGVNHYTSVIANYTEDRPIGEPSYENDKSTLTWTDPSWSTAASSWLKVYPDGLRQILKWVHGQYGIDIMVTENGYSDIGTVNDDERVSYFKQYLTAMLLAVYEDHIPVIGYTAWSLLDNFEWLAGYTQRFGLYHIDFSDESRPRIAKKSVKFFKDLIASRCILGQYGCI